MTISFTEEQRAAIDVRGFAYVSAAPPVDRDWETPTRYPSE